MRQKSNVLLAELLDENPKLENTLNHARHLRPAFETLVFASYLCLTLKKLKNDSAEHGAYFSREQFEEEQSVLAVYAQNIDHWMEHVLKDMHASNEATTIVNQRLGRKIADYILANPLDTSEPQDPPPLPKPRPRSR